MTREHLSAELLTSGREFARQGVIWQIARGLERGQIAGIVAYSKMTPDPCLTGPDAGREIGRMMARAH
jgi:hypothetical protein